VAKALKSEGVDTIFTLCGGHIIDIYDGCIDEASVRGCRHEQVAAHAATAMRGRPEGGLRGDHGRPGCTNAVTGDRHGVSIGEPVLHIGGQSALAQMEDGRAAGSAARGP